MYIMQIDRGDSVKILFWGDTARNNGPMNINKGIIANLTEPFVTVKRCGKYRDFIDACWKLTCSDVLVVSGVSRIGYLLVKAAKLLQKPSVYIMHGCGKYEIELNRVTCPGKGLEWEAYLLEKADLLLPVSEKFMHWVHGRYPEYAEKTKFLYNGIDKSLFDSAVVGQKKSGSVAVSGGLTPLKNNMPVLKAVEALQGKAFLTIYGASADGHRTYARKVSKLPHDRFLQELAGEQLFVLNSVFETFSIAVMEALACGCSILVSEVAGITGLLALEETDLIHDPMDKEEIRRKMEYLLDHPNRERILSQFDAEEWTFDKMVQRLEKHCKELMQKRK